MGHTQKIQHHLLILRMMNSSLNSAYDLSLPLPCNLTRSQVPGNRTGHLWRTIIPSSIACNVKAENKPDTSPKGDANFYVKSFGS